MPSVTDCTVIDVAAQTASSQGFLLLQQAERGIRGFLSYLCDSVELFYGLQTK